MQRLWLCTLVQHGPGVLATKLLYTCTDKVAHACASTTSLTGGTGTMQRYMHLHFMYSCEHVLSHEIWHGFCIFRLKNVALHVHTCAVPGTYTDATKSPMGCWKSAALMAGQQQLRGAAAAPDKCQNMVLWGPLVSSCDDVSGWKQMHACTSPGGTAVVQDGCRAASSLVLPAARELMSQIDICGRRSTTVVNQQWAISCDCWALLPAIAEQ